MNVTVTTVSAERPKRQRMFQATWGWILGAVWLGTALLGWSVLLEHTYQPASTANGVADWPRTDLPASPGGYCIVVFAHPFCPCTRATLDKFDESLTRLPDSTSVQVIFATAGLSPDQVARSSTVAFARRLKRVDVRCDETGQEVRRFGARVSGEVFAFDPQGRRIFHGGVTAGRGHQGGSAGQQQLERLIKGVSQEACATPVFGCALPVGDAGG